MTKYYLSQNADSGKTFEQLDDAFPALKKHYSIEDLKLFQQAREIVPKYWMCSDVNLNSPEDVYNTYLRDFFTFTVNHEFFVVLYLNSRNSLLDYTLMEGGCDSVNVDTKVIIRNAYMIGCSQIIVAHNHPSGDTKPSDADRSTTISIKKKLELMEINLLDHFICTPTDFVSLAKVGII